MKLVQQNRWICDATDVGTGWAGGGGVADARWLLHGTGCIRVGHRQNALLVQFDGRLFGQARCEQLIEEIDRVADRVATYEFSVWSGAAEPAGWARYTARSAADARRYAGLVCAVAGAYDAAGTITATELRFERLLLERRGYFDEVVAAWLLDREPGSAVIGRLFGPGREGVDEGLKIVRRFGDNLAFDSYRAPSVHTWTRDQGARMTGNDLHTVRDRRLAHTLRAAAGKVAATRAPLLERIRGAILLEWGVAFTEYYRLSLPLSVDGEGRTDAMLIATRW